jgi:glycine hydroxymethyltransferase
MTDFLMRGDLGDLDPEVQKMIEYETERQFRKLIMIPSESTAPAAVRESLGSVFQNIYAEGYPDEDTRWMSEAELFGLPLPACPLPSSRRPRYYKVWNTPI